MSPAGPHLPRARGTACLPASGSEPNPGPPRHNKPAARFWLAGLLLAALALLSALAGDFGQSTDDEADAQFGIDSLRAYLGSAEFLTKTPDRLFYGPAYWMFSAGAVEAIQSVGVNAVPVHLRHGLNATTFLVAAASVYALTRMLGVGQSSAVVTAVLFGLQPLLFGHAFINQKDTPFMALFAVTVTGGLVAVQRARRLPLANPATDVKRSGSIAVGGEPAPRSIWWIALARDPGLVVGLVGLVGRPAPPAGGSLPAMLELVRLAYRARRARPGCVTVGSPARGGGEARGHPVRRLRPEGRAALWVDVRSWVALAALRRQPWRGARRTCPGLRARTGRQVTCRRWVGFAVAGSCAGAVRLDPGGRCAGRGAGDGGTRLYRPSRGVDGRPGRSTGCPPLPMAFLTWPYLWLCARFRHLRESDPD